MRVMVLAAAASVAAPAAAQEGPVRALVERFEAARVAFDPAALDATLAPEYEEVSPVGEVDSRAAVLGFYAADRKRPAPPMSSDETIVRMLGDTALVTARRSIAVPGGPVRSIRVRYVAQRAGGRWRLVSAQYTPIPPARDAGAGAR
jgi:ketosteroid isomerase-like protein